ncbi:hypothetical protein AWZ03_014239 [Drosophila navojoa]|uniref:Uncharacterized protein n=1 Tax=Drosophila navojoa TaxID=7232 RepID=A0A484ARX2_DRONA|nr:hypothetical protein AWZ03_014239 [Drosophila navojoa]
MPQSDRPSSPEDPTTDQYCIHHLEQDLYELLEEQQLLLNIVAQQQERLERHLEIQRALLEAPPAREETPESEMLEAYETVVEVEQEPKPEAEPPMKPSLESETESKPEAESEPEPKPKPEPESKLEEEEEPKVESKLEVELEQESKLEMDPEPEEESKLEVYPEPEEESKLKMDPEPEEESKMNVEPEPKVQTDSETESELDSESKLVLHPESESETESELKSDMEPESKLKPEPNAAVEFEQLAVNESNEQQQDAQPNDSDLVPPLPPPRCICNVVQRSTRRNSRSSEDTRVAQCTPPKRNGLGYDAPFPYPKRMAKTRERRALFIFTLVDNLVLQLQRCISLAETGAPPMPICSAPSDQLTIVELDNEPEQKNEIGNEKEKDYKKEDEKEKDEKQDEKKPAPVVNKNTGAVPKQNYRPIEKAAKSPYEPKPPKRPRKKPVRESEQMDVEIDLDCEFGMQYIEKFRANRIREDVYLYKSTLESTVKEDIDAMAAALGLLDVDGENNAQQVKPPMRSWYKADLAPPKAQLETRACSPDQKTFTLLPTGPTTGLSTGLPSNHFINMMPSTSAQARALSMAMSIPVHQPESVRSSLSPSPLDVQAFLTQPLDSFNQLENLPDRIIGFTINRTPFGNTFEIKGTNATLSKLPNSGNDLNAAPPFGVVSRVNRVEGIRRPIATEPPSPPPNIFHNPTLYTPINEPTNVSTHSKDDENDVELTAINFCGQEYTASSPGNR